MESVDLAAHTARVRRMDVLGIDVQVLFSYFWLIAAAAAADDTVAAEVRDRFLSTRRADLRQLLERGADRGEIAPDFVGLTVDFVYGSLWYRLIFQVGPLDYTWDDDVATAIANGGR